MIKLSYLLFIISGLLIISLTYCNRDKKLDVSHAFLTASEFNNLSRAEQVQNCAGCHAKEYENEMKGPHANSYKMLMEHFDYIHKPEYDNEGYKTYSAAYRDKCAGCHAAQTEFELTFSKFPDSEEGIKQIMAEQHWMPQVRKDSLSLITGVDCITCHYNGENVVSTIKYKPGSVTKANCPAYCTPQKSAILSSNASCIPCHSEQVQLINPKFNSTSITTSDCNGCHAEHDANGKFTHYYYWAGDPVDKPKPAHLDLFTGINCNLNQERNVLNIKWRNTLLPHAVSWCTELIADISVYDDKNKLVAAKQIHANRKPEQDEVMLPYFKGEQVPGKHDLVMGDKTQEKDFTLTLPANYKGKLKVVIEGVKKEQYWLSDTLHTKIHYRELEL